MSSGDALFVFLTAPCLLFVLLHTCEADAVVAVVKSEVASEPKLLLVVYYTQKKNTEYETNTF